WMQQTPCTTRRPDSPAPGWRWYHALARRVAGEHADGEALHPRRGGVAAAHPAPDPGGAAGATPASAPARRRAAAVALEGARQRPRRARRRAHRAAAPP